MKLAMVLWGMVLVGAIVFAGGMAGAQDLDVKWLAGTWRGTSPSPMGMDRVDKRELLFREDGGFSVEIESARGGFLKGAGNYKIVGSELVVDGVNTHGGVREIRGTKFTYALKRVGEDLEGTLYSYGTGLTYPIALKRAK